VKILKEKQVWAVVHPWERKEKFHSEMKSWIGKTSLCDGICNMKKEIEQMTKYFGFTFANLKMGEI